MDKEKINDEYISQLIQSIEFNEPEIPELSVLKKNKHISNKKNIIYLLKTIAASLILIIGTLFISNPGKVLNREAADKPEIKEISEIRTDFVLRGDNIKIIWIQKKDFKINKT